MQTKLNIEALENRLLADFPTVAPDPVPEPKKEAPKIYFEMLLEQFHERAAKYEDDKVNRETADMMAKNEIDAMYVISRKGGV